jgi:serine protease
MSLGGPFPVTTIRSAIEYARGKGVVVVAAAGNDGRGRVSYPARYPGVLAVASTQFDESTTFYSNWGPQIDIAGPGGNTRVDQNGDGKPDGVLQNTVVPGNTSQTDYLWFMGTSMASPHVAGVAALVVGEGVTDPDAVETILKETSRKPHAQSYVRDKYGSGIIDAPAAILKARSSTGGWQLGLGLLVAGAVAASARKRGLGVKLGPSYLLGVVIGASGLFFLPWISASLASLPGMEAMTRGLPSWDLSLLGPTGHGNALFFSALVPLALLAGLWGVQKLRAPLAGLAAGVAGHLLFFAAVPMTTVQHVPHVFGLGMIWLALNAVACIFLARLALRR